MTLLLRDVHYILARGQRAGECRMATVEEAGLNPDKVSADLYVDLTWVDIGVEGEVAYADPGENWPLSTIVKDVEMGHALGTFHMAAECRNPRKGR